MFVKLSLWNRKAPQQEEEEIEISPDKEPNAGCWLIVGEVRNANVKNESTATFLANMRHPQKVWRRANSSSQNAVRGILNS